MLDPDEVKELFEKEDYHGSVVLEVLLKAHRMTCIHYHFAVADQIERAIYQFRVSEREKLMLKIQEGCRRE